MADNREQEFRQKIILILEEQTKGTGKLLDILKKSDKATKSALSSTAKHSKALSGLSKIAFGAGKALGVLGFAVKGLGLAMSALTAISSLGKKFVLFAAQTGKGVEAVQNLRKSYKNLEISAGDTLVSLRDLTAGMSDFASQSFTQLSMASQRPAQDFIASLQQSLTKAVGSREQAKQMASALNKAFANEPILLKSLVSGFNAAGGDIDKQIAALQQVDISLDDRSVLNVINALKSSKTIGEDSSSAFLTWSEVVNKLRVEIEQIGEEILVTFGPELKILLENTGNFIRTAVIKPLKWLTTTLLEANEGFMITFGGKGAVIEAHLAEVDRLGQSMGNLTKQMEKARDSGDEEKVKELRKSWDRLAQQQAQAQARAEGRIYLIEDEKNAQDKVGDTLEEQSKELARIQEAQRILNELTKNYAEQLKAATSDAKSLTEIFRITGREITGGNQESISNMISTANAAIIENTKLLSYNNQEIAERQKQLANAKGDEQATEVANRLLNAALEKRSQTLNRIEESYKVVASEIELSTQAQQNQLEIIERQKTKMQTIMDISKAIYGSAALAVEAQMQIVNLIEQEKKQIQDKLDIARRILAENDILENRKKVLELENELLAKNKEQLEIVRQLKDGYLDAVEASAFGAGKFEKILITQEKNLGKALDQNIAKKNILLGQSGTAASAGSITPFRFSTAGIGALTDSTGAAVNAAERNQQFVNNIADPQSKALAQSSQNFVMSTNVLADAINKNTAVQQHILKGTNAAGVGALKGTSAGSVATGEAMRTGKNPISSLSGGAAQSKVNRAVRAITNDLIPALQGLARMLDDKIAADENVATDRRGSSGSPTFGA